MVAKCSEEDGIVAASPYDVINELLHTIHVCKLCQLRISGRAFMDDHVLDETPVKDGSHCSACLGILEGFNLLTTTRKVVEILRRNDYDSSTFSLGLCIPQCLQLRETAVRAYLMDNGQQDVAGLTWTPIKTVAKFFICKIVKELIGKELETKSPLFVKFDFKFAGGAKELSNLGGSRQSNNRKRYKKGKEVEPNYHDALSKISISNIKKFAPVPPQSLQEACKCEVSVSCASIHIGGRYNKYSRNLSQTPWFIEGTRRGDTSVLELIGEPLKRFTRGDEMKFLSAGREDIDVRMLGNGRPFAVEIINPKKMTISVEEMAELETEINKCSDQVAVHDLQMVTKADLEIMKKGEEEKSKRYTAKLWCPDPISDEKVNLLNSMAEIELKQKTPIRVLHRRPLATRLRHVHEIELKRTAEEKYFELNVLTQAGTYIKELVHGDVGRTEPSLRTLLGLPIDIVELDVMSISLDWPPPVVRK